MKQTLLFVMSLLSMIILPVSCSDVQIEQERTKQEELINKSEMLDAITSIKIDETIANEVFNLVCLSIEKGLDENLYLRELWEDEPLVKVSSANGAPVLKSRLSQFFAQEIKTKGNDIIEIMNNSNWVIYWPYSENWDGKTMPVITPVPDNIKQEWNYGYRIKYDESGKQRIEQVYVDDDFAYENPVWIIKEGFDYDALPNFNQGETTKNGLTYLMPKTKTGTDTIHIWTFHRAQVTKQYDSLFEGASNFKLTITYPIQEGSVNANTIHTFAFLRSEIRKKEWKTLNLLLNSDWTEEQISNGLHIVETDGGVEMERTMVTKYKLFGVEYEITNKVKYQDDDDFIDSQVYARTYVFSPLGRSTQNCDGGGFKYVMDWSEYVY